MLTVLYCHLSAVKIDSAKPILRTILRNINDNTLACICLMLELSYTVEENKQSALLKKILKEIENLSHEQLNRIEQILSFRNITLLYEFENTNAVDVKLNLNEGQLNVIKECVIVELMNKSGWIYYFNKIINDILFKEMH